MLTRRSAVTAAGLAVVALSCSSEPRNNPASSASDPVLGEPESGQSSTQTVEGPVASTGPSTEGAPAFNELPPIDREVIARAGVSVSDELIDLEYQVVSMLLTDCMAQRGFEFDRGPRPAVIDPVGHRPWHPLDAEYAATYGYRAAPRPPSAMNDRANSDPAFSDALFGQDSGQGCFGAVVDFVDDRTGSVQFAEDVSVLRQEPLEDMAGWYATDEHQRLVSEWSACMSEHGYNFGSPSDALGSSGDGGPPTQDEIDLRLTDIDCDRSVGLTAARSDYETGVVDQWADENAEAIRDLSDRGDDVAASLIDLQGVDHDWG